MDKVTSAYNALLQQLIDSRLLSEWEMKTFTDILVRSPPVYSFKQKRMFRNSAARCGIPFINPEETPEVQVNRKEDEYHRVMSHCSLERLRDGRFIITDRNGTRYGPPAHVNDLKVILPWFNEVLKLQEARRTAKRAPKPPPTDCPF